MSTKTPEEKPVPVFAQRKIDRRAMRDQIDFWRETVDKVASVFTNSGLESAVSFQMMKRAALVRQFESLDFYSNGSHSISSGIGVTSLRPAYEELIWIDFLSNNPQHADEIVQIILRREIYKSLQIQGKYLGLLGNKHVGIPRRIEQSIKKSRNADAKRIVDLYRDCGLAFNEDSNDTSTLFIDEKTWKPSVSALAKITNRQKAYSYIYHATSRFCHFSTVELFRRVWGSPPLITVTSSHFSRYWEEFHFWWAMQIFLEMIDILSDITTGAFADEDFRRYLTAIEKSNLKEAPLVTPDELNLSRI